VPEDQTTYIYSFTAGSARSIDNCLMEKDICTRGGVSRITTLDVVFQFGIGVRGTTYLLIHVTVVHVIRCNALLAVSS